MNHKRHRPNPKHDDHRVKDTCYRAGRAAVMTEKTTPPSRGVADRLYEAAYGHIDYEPVDD